MLSVENLSVSYGNFTALNSVNFHVYPGQWFMIVGPNGAGKSTVVDAISQGTEYQGCISFQDVDLKQIKSMQRAQSIAILSQQHSAGYAFTVEEVVKLGRYSHRSSVFSTEQDIDEEKVEEALTMTGMSDYRNQSILTLSGGELQRTFLSQVFAQDPKLLILDEPTNHLDLVYQKQIFELIQNWVTKEKRAVISVVHDLSLAKSYGTHGLLLHKGNVVASGAMDVVLNRENLTHAYGMDVNKWMIQLLKQWE